MTIQQQRTPETRTATPDDVAAWRCGVPPLAEMKHRPSLSWRLRH